MKIQLLSDLHNEFMRSERPAPAHHWAGVISASDTDLIILAGDIDIGTLGVEWAIAESQRLAKTILYVFGNHEFYYHEYEAVKQQAVQLCLGTAVHILDSDVFIKDDVRFIGTTLWTDYRANKQISQQRAMEYIGQVLVDHRKIDFKSDNRMRKFLPVDALALHNAELRWLEAQLAKNYAGKTVVITHHGPHNDCQNPAYPVNELSAAFHSDLSRVLMEYDIDVWAYGHTHANLDKLYYNTRVISNQSGYPGEGIAGFDAALIIEL